MASDRRRSVTLPDTIIEAGDTILLRADPDALERAVRLGGLSLARRESELAANGEKPGFLEAVVTPGSLLVGRSAAQEALRRKHAIDLLAVSRAGHRMTERLSEMPLATGDALLLRGPAAFLPERLRELSLLPLAERGIALGRVRKELLPILILAAAMGLTALGLVPVAISPRDAYDSVEWPILVMIGALIPVSEALQRTGGTELIGAWLSGAAAGLPVWCALAIIMVAAMAVTPFLNNAATVLVMAPIAATFAGDLGYRPDAFLMAVAVGAGCDFLTPIGHQRNTLVMGPGGYRFGDYARLGAPLSLLVVLVGVPLILAVWG